MERKDRLDVTTDMPDAESVDAAKVRQQVVHEVKSGEMVTRRFPLTLITELSGAHCMRAAIVECKVLKKVRER